MPTYKYCKAEIMFRRTAAANLIPLNAKPVEQGKFVIIGNVAMEASPDSGNPRFDPHGPSCGKHVAQVRAAKKTRTQLKLF